MNFTIRQFLSYVHSSITHVADVRVFQQPPEHRIPAGLRSKICIATNGSVSDLNVAQLSKLNRREVQSLLKVGPDVARLVEDLLMRIAHVMLAS